MNYKITNGAVDLGAETILEEINIDIKNKEKVAIVGRNGAREVNAFKGNNR